jgi:hypothetical protein
LVSDFGNDPPSVWKNTAMMNAEAVIAMKNELILAAQAAPEEREAKIASVLARFVIKDVVGKDQEVDEDSNETSVSEESDKDEYEHDSYEDRNERRSVASRIINKAVPTRPAVFLGERANRAALWRAFKIQMDLYLVELSNAGEVMSERRKCEKLVMNMGGSAVTIADTQRLRQLKAGRSSYKALISELDRMWLRRDAAQLHDELFNIEQSSGEPTEDYYERFCVLFNEVTMNDEIGKDMAANIFCKGLLDVLKQKVEYRRQADSILRDLGSDEAEEAVARCFDVAIAEETFLKKRGKGFLLNKRSANQSTQSSSSNNATRNQTNEQSKNNSKGSNKKNGGESLSKKFSLSKDQLKDHFDTGKCFVCHATGHLAFDCPKRSAHMNMMQEYDDESSSSDENEPAAKPQSTKSKNV